MSDEGDELVSAPRSARDKLCGELALAMDAPRGALNAA
ncbi:hypothetical protein HEB94_009485 [Actinopolymorpha pittospori]|uniref:Uncharacterized protein n=1 Tax=Actinopolymorpha pittospori TaxID=648752 RepID=A0A927N6N0_9ACTN|nr:hypothetical protein [Actinopolymorpha pittospori]